MFANLKRLAAGLTLAIAATLTTVAMASPAQAAPAPVTKCGAWVKAAPTNLYLQTCATRDGINTTGKTTVRNFGNTSHYVAELDVKMDFVVGYTVCPVNSWIAPATAGSCTDPANLTNLPTYAIGWVYYWTGSQFAWLNANSPTV